jgi:hypothetical protein
MPSAGEHPETQDQAPRAVTHGRFAGPGNRPMITSGFICTMSRAWGRTGDEFWLRRGSLVLTRRPAAGVMTTESALRT